MGNSPTTRTPIVGTPIVGGGNGGRTGRVGAGGHLSCFRAPPRRPRTRFGEPGGARDRHLKYNVSDDPDDTVRLAVLSHDRQCLFVLTDARYRCTSAWRLVPPRESAAHLRLDEPPQTRSARTGSDDDDSEDGEDHNSAEDTGTSKLTRIAEDVPLPDRGVQSAAWHPSNELLVILIEDRPRIQACPLGVLFFYRLRRCRDREWLLQCQHRQRLRPPPPPPPLQMYPTFSHGDGALFCGFSADGDTVLTLTNGPRPSPNSVAAQHIAQRAADGAQLLVGGWVSCNGTREGTDSGAGRSDHLFNDGHQHFTCGACHPTDARLCVAGTSTGEVVFFQPSPDPSAAAASPPVVALPLRNLLDPQLSSTPSDLRAAGYSLARCRAEKLLSAETCYRAGFAVADILACCAEPDAQRGFAGAVGCRVVCEGTVGTITYVRRDDPWDIRVLMDGGERNRVNTIEGCLATDGFGQEPCARGDVRYLCWAGPQARTRSKPPLHDTERSFRSAVSALAFSGDGRILVCGSDDTTAKIVVSKTRRVWHVLSGHHTRAITCVAVNPQATLCATGSRDNTAAIWNVEEGELVTVIEHSYLVASLTFSPAGKHVVSASWDDTLKVTHVFFSGKTEEVVQTRMDSRIVRVWVAESGRLLVITGEGVLHDFEVSGLRAAAGTDHTVNILLYVRYACSTGQ